MSLRGMVISPGHLVLLLSSGAVAIAFVAEIPGPPDTPAPTEAASLRVFSQNAFLPEDGLSDQEIDEFASRPLFSETRRAEIPLAEAPPPEEAEPEEAPPPPAAAPPEPPAALRLLGTFRKGEDYIGLFASGQSDAQNWLPVGSVIDGWTIIDIKDSIAVFRNGKHEFTVSLFR